MEPIQKQLEEQSARLATIEASVKKTERYMMWAFWTTIVLFVLPLIGLLFIVPMAMNSYLSSFEGLI